MKHSVFFSVRYLIIFVALLILTIDRVSAQYGDKKVTVNGYLKYLQTVFYDDFKGDWMTDNLIHNRINLHWYPSTKFNGAVEFRNRFFYGDFIETIPDYKEMVVKDNGYIDLSFDWTDGQSYLLNTTIDRIYFDYIEGDFQARI